MLKNVVAFVLLITNVCFAQHSIKGTFYPPENYKLALLYKVTPTISKYITKADVKKDGTFELKLDSTATKGIYRVVYAVPQEDYNFDVIYNKKEDIELSFSSDKGLKFIKSSENKMLSAYVNSMSLMVQNISNFYKQQNKDTSALSTIFKNQKATQLSYENKAKGMIVLNFIKASRPYIPNAYQSVKEYKQNVKKHYFDYIDFNDKILQSSNFIEERMLNYVFGVSDEKLDKVANYKSNIDMFCKEIKGIPNEVKRILLVDLWEQMRDSGYETVSNYITEIYLKDIAVALNDKELINVLQLLSNVSIGKIAPDFSWQIEKDKTKITKKLSEFKNSKYYAIVFWSSGCSHCMDDIPQLYNFSKAQPKGFVHVIAIALEDEPTAWHKLIKKYPEFNHIYGKGKWDNNIVKNYGVKATPSYFILDSNKKILAKPEDFDGFKAFFKDKK